MSAEQPSLKVGRVLYVHVAPAILAADEPKLFPVQLLRNDFEHPPVASSTASVLFTLTQREREVLQYVAGGAPRGPCWEGRRGPPAEDAMRLEPIN